MVSETASAVCTSLDQALGNAFKGAYWRHPNAMGRTAKRCASPSYGPDFHLAKEFAGCCVNRLADSPRQIAEGSISASCTASVRSKPADCRTGRSRSAASRQFHTVHRIPDVRVYVRPVDWDEGHGIQKTKDLARQYKAIVAFLNRELSPEVWLHGCLLRDYQS